MRFTPLARRHEKIVVSVSDEHRLRVLLLFSSSELGGAERSLSRMALASQGTDYEVATLNGEGPWCEWIRSQGREPLVLGCKSVGGGLMLGAFWRLIRHVRCHPVNVIYVCGARAALLLRFLRIFMPGIKLVHGVRWNPDSNSRLDRFFRLMERLTHSLVDACITNSAVAKQTLVSRCNIPAERIFVIHNGLESLPTDVPPMGERPLEVLTVANLNPRKGHREFLQVVREVLKAVSDAKFVFVGRDDMGGDVKRMIADTGLTGHVRCEGFQADVSTWFRRARVFVLPSLWNEGCPTAILEAMSFAVPCVAFAMDGIPELVEDGDHGILLHRGDYSGMAFAIISMLTDASRASKLGMQGRDRVHSHFSLMKTEALHSAVFNEIILGSGE
jgi:glycosyltransferase involved in cell wall biosynthesis